MTVLLQNFRDEIIAANIPSGMIEWEKNYEAYDK